MTRHILALVVLSLAGSPAAAQLAPPPDAAAPSVEAAAVETLQADLHRIIAEPGWGQQGYGVIVVSLERGDTLFSLNADRPLTPASNAKLFSTAAALYFLGPDFRYSTQLLADGPVEGGVLSGDLILHGSGDPSLSGRMLEGPGAVLRTLVRGLEEAGVRRITGDVVGDGSYFDDRWIGPGWQESDLDNWYGAPVGALSLAENVVSIRFLPERAGSPASIRTTPATVGLAVDNRVRTVASGSSSVTIERSNGRLIATGRVRAGGNGVVRSIPVVDPANFAAAALRAVLQERGITVDGGVRTVTDPRESRVVRGGATPPVDAPRIVAAHLSPPLSEIASVTNHVSHNLFAEALVKTVGRVVLGEGSFAAGTRAIESFLGAESGDAPLALDLVDGSGLSRNNLLSARTTIRLLDYMRRSDLWNVYFSSLPEAAHREGLETRMRGTAAAGNLRAKTGTIRQVSALSGYVTSADGETLAFSIIANGVPSTSRAKRSEDAIGARLASFTRQRPEGRR